ncbi:MAG: Tim44 domain-containing protein [Desulfobacterium sp.]|jgi:predicted lipid-binding transport protein (Tim44 family)|nr:Tim44 domain-containing protein [Desulfobacterium sp.]
MQMVSKTKVPLMILTVVMFFLVAGIMETADARVKRGGRSFKKAPATSAPAKPKPAAQAKSPQAAANPMGGSFARGLAGGVMGGVLGSMLFGGMAHAGGGGLGGSGIGVFEILLLAGVGYFLYRRFSRRKALAGNTGAPSSQDDNSLSRLFSGGSADQENQSEHLEDPLVTGVREIWDVDNSFDPDAFKETAQDLFFKIQAGWTRRDASVLEPFVGNQLLDEYKQHFDELKERGHFNRLENIAVRNVELIAAGVQDREIFVTVRFTANLLDYTVDETSGEIVKGDSENSIKFEEEWTFTTPVGAKKWKLEGIEV